MNPVNPHQDISLLEAYALGKVDRSTADTVARHLKTCVDCRRVVAAAPTDEFQDELQAAAASFPPIDAAVVASAPAEPIPPILRNCSEYEVIREINHGGMGVVYLVRNRRMDRLEGLKVVNESLVKQPGTLERFEREMRSAARLNHPNIVTAYSSPAFDGLLAFAMEFIDGTDLYKLVKTRGPLPVSNSCYYTYQAAQGLQHAHDRQMVHRDIKPNNLMLMRDGKKQVVKILDFGLAKATRENPTEGGMTGTGQMLGTPHYMAPEQIECAAKADIRADIYSLGCTLYYLLTGDPPFKNRDNLYSILHAHQSEIARPLNELRTDVPPELGALVAKMMAKDPAQRLQTPAEVAQALAPYFKRGIKPIPTQHASLPLSATGTLESVASKDTNLRKPPTAAAVPAVSNLLNLESPHGNVAKPIQTMLEMVVDAEDPLFARVGRRHMSRSKMPRPMVWVGLMACLLIVGWLGAWALSVFRVKTSEGILVIEASVPNPDVFVDGDQVTVTWEDGGKQAEVRVKPGERQIEVRKAGYAVAEKKLIFKNDERTIFEAKLVPTVVFAKAKGDQNGDLHGKAKAARVDIAVSLEGSRAGEVRDDNNLQMQFVWCPSGEFTMGSPPFEEGRFGNEELVKVTLTKGFWLGKTEVTQAEWQRMIGTTPWKTRQHAKDEPDYPATYVTWNDAITFCQKLTEQERQASRLPSDWEYTLPTEAQWEYACRAGTVTRYSFGDDDLQLRDYGWFNKNADSAGEKFAHRVGLKKSNPWGLFDMHGNVTEWCSDIYAAELPGGTDPVATSGESGRVYRGGAWDRDASRYCRSADRGGFSVGSRFDNLGFRIALTSVSAGTSANLSKIEPVVGKISPQKPTGTRAGEERDDNGLQLKFVWCPPGEFTMGSPKSEDGRGTNEDQVKVTLTKGFWLGKTEVTQGQWLQMMETAPWEDDTHVKAGPDYPVTFVSWHDANAFCQELTERERQAARLPSDWEYTLPTEAQWEYACRAGTTTPYSFGTDKAQLHEYGWFAGTGDGILRQVGLKKSNPWGLLDLHGNVWEWCRDFYAKELPGGTDPEYMSGIPRRIIRGGCIINRSEGCRSAIRSWCTPESGGRGTGFRVALASVSAGTSASSSKIEPTVGQSISHRMEGTLAGDERHDNELQMRFVWCPPGEFTMGSPKSEVGREMNEVQVEVTLTKGFWLGKTEVTQAEWQRVMETTPWKKESFRKSDSDLPARNVDWQDATTFCQKLTEQERQAARLPSDWEYTLPTEAQWEYACRAGTTTSYSFGTATSMLRDYAASPIWTDNVGIHKPNPWGLLDMHGNVSEWCRDLYTVKLPGGIDPEVTSMGSLLRVTRGGSYTDKDGSFCRSAARHKYWSGLRQDDIGFRVALTSVSAGASASPSKIEPAVGQSISHKMEGTQAGVERDDNDLQMRFVWCPPGEFAMGSLKSEVGRGMNEDQVEVTLTKGFWLGKTEVTQAEWQRVMETTPWKKESFRKSDSDLPARNVDWQDATTFCQKLTEQERQAARLPSDWEYTLPTEAQWEYACRAGTTTSYSFGTATSMLRDYAASPTWTDNVGIHKPNPWGLLDMHGNVSEWCRDLYTVKLPGGIDPEVTSMGSLLRVTRGGSYTDKDGSFCRSAARREFRSGYRHDDTGFRVALCPSGNK